MHGGCSKLDEQRTDDLSDSLPVFELNVGLVADPPAEDGRKGESRGHSDDVSEEEQTQRADRELLDGFVGV